MKTRMIRRRRRGFTLMEVLLVLVILVILGSVVAVSLSGARKRAFVDSAKTQLTSFKSALTAYNVDIGTYPSTQQGLAALRDAPADLRNPAKFRGPYADASAPLDPWGNDYRYESDGQSFRVWSGGPNGQDEGGTGDDVVLVGE